MSSVAWDKLRHAYGPAGDVPALLARARTAPAGGAHTDEPWFSLWSALCHQGDVYTASYAAVPELVAIAKARAGEHAAARECLLLAGMIELDRAQPDGSQAPPAVPPSLLGAYRAALAEAAPLAARLLPAERDPDWARGLAAVCAALRGDLAEARRLERDDEDEP